MPLRVFLFLLKPNKMFPSIQQTDAYTVPSMPLFLQDMKCYSSLSIHHSATYFYLWSFHLLMGLIVQTSYTLMVIPFQTKIYFRIPIFTLITVFFHAIISMLFHLPMFAHFSISHFLEVNFHSLHFLRYFLISLQLYPRSDACQDGLALHMKMTRFHTFKHLFQTHVYFALLQLKIFIDFISIASVTLGFHYYKIFISVLYYIIYFKLTPLQFIISSVLFQSMS